MRAARRLAIGLGLVLIAAVGACQWLLPERFAVNAPMLKTLLGVGGGAPASDEYTGRMRAAEGFGVSIFAEVGGARMLEFTPAGDLLVSAPRSDRIWRLAPDHDGDGRSDGKVALELELDRPHGIHLFEGWLYIGEGSRISRVRIDQIDRSDPSRTAAAREPEFVAEVPSGGNHWTRNVHVGPDRKLYVTVGSSCNVCIEEDERRAAMLRFELDGSGAELYATGLRNAVDFDWHPTTRELYATDNGRDLLGDDFPPCELNRVVRAGFYGWPIASGARIPDPDFGTGQEARIRESIPPAHEFGAHTAPLGITFVRGSAAPAAYRGAALVALHGSWNRTEKDGYKVVSLHWDDAGAIEERDLLVGFEVDEDVIGRPVDVAVGPDGAFYVSDDYADVVWRIAPGETSDGGVLPGRAGGDHDPLAGIGSVELAAGAERGRQLFEAHACSSCHDPERAGPGVVVAPLAQLSARYSLESLADFFDRPTPPMPVFPLADEEKRDLAVFLLQEFD